MGVTQYLSTLIFVPLSQNPRQSPRIEGFETFSIQPLADWLAALEGEQRVLLSDAAGLLGGLVSGLTPLVVLGFLLVPVSYYLLWRTRFGLRLRSCGEHPVAAESLGVKVFTYKYLAVIISGGLAGLGGAALTLNPGQLGYLEGQTGGRGYIGLAAMIFGNWRPGGAAAAASIFGYANALQLRDETAVHGLLLFVAIAVFLAGALMAWRRSFVKALVLVAVGGVFLFWWLTTDAVPRQFIFFTPHVTTLVVLAFASQRLRMPARVSLSWRRRWRSREFSSFSLITMSSAALRWNSGAATLSMTHAASGVVHPAWPHGMVGPANRGRSSRTATGTPALQPLTMKDCNDHLP
jgi:general nucleoside transport system permease protein